MSPSRLTLAASLFAVFALLNGCGPSVEVNEAWDTDPPLRVAVLPFVPPDEDEDTLDKVDFIRNETRDQLSNLPLALVTNEQVDARLGRATAKEIVARDPLELADALRVDALIYGEVITIQNVAPLLGYYRWITCRVRCVARDGTELWSVEHKESELGGPIPDLGSQVITALIEQVENSSNLAFVRLAERWASKTIEQVPQPAGVDTDALAQSQAPPVIASFDATPSRDGPLRPGDRIDVVVRAPDDLQVRVEVLGGSRWVTLAPTGTDEYRGSYIVQPGDGGTLAQLTAVAVSDTQTIGRMTIERQIEVDAMPPRVPGGLVAETTTDGVDLRWETAEGVDWIVYRAPADSPGAIEEVGRTSVPALTDDGAAAGSAYRYAVVAVRGDMYSHPASVRVAR